MGLIQTINNMLGNVFYEQNYAGDNNYSLESVEYSQNLKNNYIVAQGHPILTSGLTFISQLFAQADFYLEDKEGNKITEHWLLDLLENPGYKVSQSDHLESVFFNRIPGGTTVIHVESVGVGIKPHRLNILDVSKLRFPLVSVKKFKDDDYKNETVLYNGDKLNQKIPLEDLLFVRDLPLVPFNVLETELGIEDESGKINSRYAFLSKSRLDGLNQTLLNTVVSLEAKQTILKSNGRELIKTNNKDGVFPLDNDEKNEAESKLNSGKGMLRGQSRSWITKSDVSWQSLHIALRDLGLDESLKADGTIIYTALHIPPDIASLDKKKTTYDNQKESIVSFLQNEMEPMLKDYTTTFDPLLKKEGLKLKGTYDNLPVMKYILLQYFNGVLKQAEALAKLQAAGIPWKEALKMCKLDPNIEKNEETYQSGGTGNADGQTESSSDGQT